jgi:hypothetical protein
MRQALLSISIPFWQQDADLDDTNDATSQATQVDNQGRRRDTEWANDTQPSTPVNNLQVGQGQAQVTESGAESWK